MGTSFNQRNDFWGRWDGQALLKHYDRSLNFKKACSIESNIHFFLCLFCMDHLQCMAVNFFFITKEETIHLLKQLLFSLRDSQIYPESLR